MSPEQPPNLVNNKEVSNKTLAPKGLQTEASKATSNGAGGKSVADAEKIETIRQDILRQLGDDFGKKDDPTPTQKRALDELENKDVIKRMVAKVQDLYIGLANKYLNEGSSLKAQILDYYSNSDKLMNELAVVFRGKNEQQINEEIERISKLFENRTFFIEHNQKIHERAKAFGLEKKRSIEKPIATDEEYELGVYKEGLEIQVQDAVFALSKKGYKTFQSGFRELNLSDQFVDVYNKNVVLPDSFIKSFKEKGFEISIDKKNDRTSIDIHPLSNEAITLEEWKKIWDEFAEKLPEAQPENFDNIKMYAQHSNFRKKQDLIRK